VAFRRETPTHGGAEQHTLAPGSGHYVGFSILIVSPNHQNRCGIDYGFSAQDFFMISISFQCVHVVHIKGFEFGLNGTDFDAGNRILNLFQVAQEFPSSFSRLPGLLDRWSYNLKGKTVSSITVHPRIQRILLHPDICPWLRHPRYSQRRLRSNPSQNPGSFFRRTISETISLPPGLSTLNASLKALSLFGTRFDDAV